MSASETESESEPEFEPSANTISTLAAFASLSATPPSRGPTAQGTVSWAVNTLATLDFRLVRKDAALHGPIQNCASTILALLNAVLQLEPPAADSAYSFIPDIISILTPSFLHLLFQYRLLFHVIAAKNFKPNSAPLAVVCWVDVVLAKLGDVAALIAAGFDRDLPDHSLPESLKARREEDNLRAAIQLPDNWDMLPSVLSSERVSSATKRLSMRLMLARYILFPALSRQVGVDNSIHALLSTFSELVRQSAARVDELRLVLGRGPPYFMEQERLSSAMAISLYAAADMAQDSINSTQAAAFRPQTVASVMQLLQFVLNEEGHCPIKSTLLNSLDRHDIPISVVIRWGVVPQWTWNIWLEYRRLHADMIVFLTMMYIQHHRAGPEEPSEIPDSNFGRDGSNNQVAMISVTLDIVLRFISILSTGGRSRQLSTSVVHESCRLITQWMNRNSSGIQSSTECCKILIILFGHLSEDDIVVNDIVIECLALVNEQCMREAWEAVIEDKKNDFHETLGRKFIQTKMAKFWDDSPKSKNIYVAQLMQFLVIMTSRGVQPLDLEEFVEFIEIVKERIIEMPPDDRGFLCEVLLTCLATANLSGIEVNGGVDDDVTWRLGMCNGDVSLSLASAFSSYLVSSALTSVEPLTRLEGVEHLADIALLICSRYYLCEDVPLALIILPTICEALGYLLGDDATEEYAWENTRISALSGILRSLSKGDSCVHGEYGALLTRRLPSAAIGAGCEKTKGARGTGRGAYELVFRRLDGVSHLLYVRVV